MYFGVLVIILVEINVEGVSLDMCKKASKCNQTHRVEQLHNGERYCALLIK